jgi:hypothetical protein
MPRADYPAAVAAVLARHYPVPEPHYRGEYYCVACTQAAHDNRPYPCAVVQLMVPHLPQRMIAAVQRRRGNPPAESEE